VPTHPFGDGHWTFPNMKSDHYDPQMAERHTYISHMKIKQNKLSSNKGPCFFMGMWCEKHFGFLGI
jgi:hypothetical protein